jgi:short-subunit dehydrogenase involved in D-alanine esterification of teichoic acids
VIPPTVGDTELKGKQLEKNDWSVSSSDVTDAAIKGLGSDEYEIPIGPTRNRLHASKSELDRTFCNMNR